MDNFDLRKYLAEGRLLKEAIDYSSIKGEMKKIYDIDVDLDTIKDFVTSYNDSEGMDVFDTTEREDFYLYLKDEGKLLKEGEYTYMNDANTEFGPDVLDLDYDKIRHYIANIKGDDFANNFIDGYNDDFYENVVRFFDKIENPTDEEVINFIDAEIEK